MLLIQVSLSAVILLGQNDHHRRSLWHLRQLPVLTPSSQSGSQKARENEKTQPLPLPFLHPLRKQNQEEKDSQKIL